MRHHPDQDGRKGGRAYMDLMVAIEPMEGEPLSRVRSKSPKTILLADSGCASANKS